MNSDIGLSLAICCVLGLILATVIFGDDYFHDSGAFGPQPPPPVHWEGPWPPDTIDAGPILP